MKGLFINCGNKECRRMLLKDAILPVGTSFSLKCANCGVSQKVEVEISRLRLIIIHRPQVAKVLTEDEDDDILMLNV